MGIDRSKRNLKMDTTDVVEYCKNKIIVIFIKWVKIGIARLIISKLLLTHIAIRLSLHILLSKFQIVYGLIYKGDKI